VKAEEEAWQVEQDSGTRDSSHVDLAEVFCLTLRMTWLRPFTDERMKECGE
jgi:hypothetical protein